MSFRTGLLWVMGVGLLGAAAVLAVVLDPLLTPALTGAHHAMGRSLHPDQAQ